MLFFLLGLFEVRLEEYQEEMSLYQPTVKQNIKDAGKKMISFLQETGEIYRNPHPLFKASNLILPN